MYRLLQNPFKSHLATLLLVRLGQAKDQVREFVSGVLVFTLFRWSTKAPGSLINFVRLAC